MTNELIVPGKKEAPLRIILTHTDIPSLRVIPQPIHIEPDAEKFLGDISGKVLRLVELPKFILCVENHILEFWRV